MRNSIRHRCREAIERSARQRLLNEPFVLISLSFSMWLLSAIIYPVAFWALDIGRYWMQSSCFMSLSTGLIIVTVAFFLLEHVLQKQLAPHFFPNGGLYTIPKTLRIRIRTRPCGAAVCMQYHPPHHHISPQPPNYPNAIRAGSGLRSVTIFNLHQCDHFFDFRQSHYHAGQPKSYPALW